MQLFKRAGATASSPAHKSVTSRPVTPQSPVAAALPERSRSVPAADTSSKMGLFDRVKKGGAAAGTSSGKPTTSSVAARAVTVGSNWSSRLVSSHSGPTGPQTSQHMQAARLSSFLHPRSDSSCTSTDTCISTMVAHVGLLCPAEGPHDPRGG